MAIKHEYEGKVGADTKLTVGTWKTIPKSRWKPTRGSASLEPTIYLNLGYVNTNTAKPGRAWVRVVRESPTDDTCNYMLWLPAGYNMVLDERNAGNKWWSADDLGRNVHVEIKVSGVKSAFLNDTCYVSYQQKW